MMRTVLSLLLALTLGVSVAEERPATERPKLIVGVTEFALSEDGRDITEALHRAAAPLADQYDLEFRSMPVPELERAARERRVDLVLGSAGLVVRLADAGAKPIVTTLGHGAINANQNEGSAFLVRRDREDLQTLGDLAGKNLVANRPSGFSGYLIAMGEIALAGNDPDHFFSSRTFIGAQNASHEIARSDTDSPTWGFFGSAPGRNFLKRIRRRPRICGFLRPRKAGAPAYIRPTSIPRTRSRPFRT